jgi:UrcA family protein
MHSRNTFLGTALLSAVFGGSAIAEPMLVSPPSEVVSYAELNLQSTVGVASLYRRIQKAADKVCEFPPAARQLSLVEVRKSCKARATERAVMQVDVPALSALHLAKTRSVGSAAQVASNK